MPINLLNADNRDWKTSVSMEKEKIKQLNLSRVDKRDWQINVNMRKKNAIESAECRQKRLQAHQEYRKNISYG